MSQQNAAPQLALELERLEQSITLTLQEIDYNFSRAHRIVTTSILPLVERYAKHSDAVWEGSKFWKQFFEASANVSLSSYEEPQDEPDEMIQEDEDVTETATPIRQDKTVTAAQYDSPTSQEQTSSFADYPSPYENLKEALSGTTSKAPPTTPGRQDYDSEADTPVPTTHSKKADPLLHRVLDKNYRIQATPHTVNKKPAVRHAPVDARSAAYNTDIESSPFSPEPIAPQLRPEIFGSPTRQAPRTPGVSVQPRRPVFGTTPGTGTRRTLFADRKNPVTPGPSWELEDEDSFELDLGISPPKTMQFHVPSRTGNLMQTPAREASKRIVKDLLLSAGVPDSTDDFDMRRPMDESPTVVRPSYEDDDF